MRNQGFTLVEVMTTVALLTVVGTGLYYVNMGMTRSSLHQEAMTMLRDEGRASLQYMVRRIRMADNGTVRSVTDSGVETLGTGIAPGLQFQMATDTDANGVAIDENFDVELTDAIRFRADTDDTNGNGLSTTELVETDSSDTVTQVLSRHLQAGGLSFERTTAGIQITIVLTQPGQGLRPLASTTVSQVVAARN